MVYKFTIISDEVEDFMREITIDADAKFVELHKLIIDSCGYSDDQLTSFTICGDGWEKGQDITLEEMDTDSDSDTYIMAETELSEFLEDEKQHLIYTFDPLSDRRFYIELSAIETGKNLKSGKVTRSIGDLHSSCSTLTRCSVAILSLLRQQASTMMTSSARRASAMKILTSKDWISLTGNRSNNGPTLTLPAGRGL